MKSNRLYSELTGSLQSTKRRRNMSPVFWRGVVMVPCSIIGLCMAGSDGPWFPYLNVAGIGIMGAGFLIVTGR